jgi:hypothetical protein
MAPVDEVSFEPGVFLLTKARASAIKGGTKPAIPSVASPSTGVGVEPLTDKTGRFCLTSPYIWGRRARNKALLSKEKPPGTMAFPGGASEPPVSLVPAVFLD